METQTENKLSLKDAVLEKVPLSMEFKPKKDIYDKVGINKHRFAKIMKGEIVPNILEVRAICDYFNIDPSTII